MAEAVVEERATVPTRFYCHMCNVEINNPNPDFTCPLCSGGFVEELPDNVTPEDNGTSANTTSPGTSSDISMGGSMLPMSDLEALRHDIASLLTSRNVPNLEITIEPGSRRANIVTLGGGSNSTGSGGTTTGSGSGASSAAGTGTSSGGGSSGSVAGGRVRPSNLDRLDNVLFDFLQSLPIGGGAGNDFGNSHMFFLGNPGDYAWGREGLDTIVTQMLNQMETSGPPPLPKQKIDEIAKVAISAEEVERKLQCSVCWDDFKIDELVRKLPCSHVYHENCIVPWLKLHGTCPICRKSLTDDDSDDSIVMEDGLSTGANGACPVHGSATQTNATGHDGTVGTATNRNASATVVFPSQTQQQQQSSGGTQTTTRNNVFTFDEENMNLD